MKLDERILQRLTELISLGEQVIRTRRPAGRNVIGDDRIDTQLASQWVTSTQSLLSRTFGENSSHFKNYHSATQGYLTYSPCVKAMGVLIASKDDFEHGFLFSVRSLVEAELFDDLLEQAEHLLASGYFQPAAVVAGCVLEDGLRRLCIKHSIVLPENTTIDPMNTELAKAAVYNKLMQKRITALADLRNRAAHGRWNEFSKSDVEEMLRQVHSFLAEMFT